MAKKPVIPVTPSSGNVFADIGVPEPEEELAKAQLASRIREIVRGSRLTQVAAAAVMGIDQPKVSALLSGRLSHFSSERLMRLLTRLGQDVEVVVKSKPRRRQRGIVSPRCPRRVIRGSSSSANQMPKQTSAHILRRLKLIDPAPMPRPSHPAAFTEAQIPRVADNDMVQHRLPDVTPTCAPARQRGQMAHLSALGRAACRPSRCHGAEVAHASDHASRVSAHGGRSSFGSRRRSKCDPRLARTRQPGHHESVRGNHGAHERGGHETV